MKKLPNMINGAKVIADLGQIFPNQNVKQKCRMAILECPECKKHRRVRVSDKRGTCYPCSIKLRKVHNKTHGEANTELYRRWAGMTSRIKHNKNYSEISISNEWATFEEFKKWSKLNGYLRGLSIDRINPRGNYEPSNCRWIEKSKQGQTKKSNSLTGIKELPSGRYNVRIGFNGGYKLLGTFDTIKEAQETRKNFIFENNLLHEVQND